METLNKP